MAYAASKKTKSRIVNDLDTACLKLKAQCESIVAQLSGNVGIRTFVNFHRALNQRIVEFNAVADAAQNYTGMVQYLRDEKDDQGIAATDVTDIIAAAEAMETWLDANLTPPFVTYANGVETEITVNNGSNAANEFITRANAIVALIG